MSTTIQDQAGTASDSSYSEIRSYGENHYAMDWASLIRFTAPTLGLMAILGGLIALTLGSGCTSKPTLDTPTANLTAAGADAPQASALQVTAPPSTPAAAPAYVPPSAAPAYAPPTVPATPDPVVTQAPAIAATTAADPTDSAAGTSYTVKHGDTLFGIAKAHYGDGKQWARIVSANPGLSPAKLKAGQKIVLP